MKKGFTLIELLVVISIIGILAALGTVRYSTIEKQSRDTQRKSDLNQYRVALENYASANSLVYPYGVSPNPYCVAIDSLCALNDFATNFLAGACLQDPRVSATGVDYNYCANGTTYTLRATLEVKGAGDEDAYFYVCSNGKSGVLESLPLTPLACPI